MTCKLCGLEHRGWVSCLKAKQELKRDVACGLVANTEPEVANRHGVYSDKEKRKAYMRELMRARRAKATEHRASLKSSGRT